MISIIFHDDGKLRAANGRPVLAAPGWLGWLIATVPLWYLLVAALFGAAALIVGIVTVAGLSALMTGGLVFLVFLAIAFLNKGPNEFVDADTILTSPLMWIVVISALGGAGVGLWMSWSTLFNFVPNFYLYAPALTFALLGFLWFVSRLFTQLTGSPIGFVLPGSRSAPQRALIALPTFALSGILAAGPVFMLTLSYLQPWVSDWWDFTEVLDRMRQEWRDGLAAFQAEAAELAILTEPLLQANVMVSLAIIIAIVWAFCVHIGVNWLVSRSLLKSLYVFVSAFFLNLIYVMVLFIFDANEGEASALVLQISGAIATVNDGIEHVFHQSLAIIFALLPVPEVVKDYLQQLGLLPARLVGLVFEIAAGITLLSEDLRRLFENFAAFKSRFDATYFFFLLASAILWSQALHLYRVFNHPPFRQIRAAYARRQARKAEEERQAHLESERRAEARHKRDSARRRRERERKREKESKRVDKGRPRTRPRRRPRTTRSDEPDSGGESSDG